MNMQIFNFRTIVLTLFSLVLFASCEKDVVATFDVNDVDITDKSLDKDRAKTNKQYISILYTTLHQKAISSKQLVSTERVIESVGDKVLVNELIYSNYMNSGEAVVPTNEEMRADLEQFVKDTYKKFYVRIPSELEVAFFVNYLEANPQITPEVVYMSFATSDEYQFY
ncbi:MAG: hypothetical protein H6607_06425 [Flavobacteriales bacterium]|nr:hypothetical protein [Flavobacteriales bacterium]